MPKGIRRGTAARIRLAVGRLRQLNPRRAAAAALLAFAALAAAASAISCSTAKPVVPAGPAGPPAPLAAAAPDTDIRVLLIEGVPAFEMGVTGPCRVMDSRGRPIPGAQFPAGIPAGPVTVRPGGVVFANLEFACSEPAGEPASADRTADAGGGAPIRTVAEVNLPPGRGWLDVVPSQPGGLLVAGNRYKGKLRIVRDGNVLSAVNVLDVEDYLAGVLRGEMPRGWQPEAYKAQAVASRTFALYEKIKRGPAVAYDVRATVASQVYHGDDGSSDGAIIRRAVADTAGQVLYCNGAMVHAYFCSTCGGMTEPADLVWRQEPVTPPIAGGTECGWCAISPRFRWGPVHWTKDEVLAKVRKKNSGSFGPGFGALTAVEVANVAARSGRPADLRLRGSTGAAVTVSAYDFRLWVSEGEPRDRQLPSSFFEVAERGNRISFVNGRGFGHAVGLCQYGAQGQALAGRDYRQILATYYPGSQLMRIK